MVQALPKTKTITFEEFAQWKPEGERYELHQVSQFRGDDRIISPTFPELNLTANQIFQAGS